MNQNVTVELIKKLSTATVSELGRVQKENRLVNTVSAASERETQHHNTMSQTDRSSGSKKRTPASSTRKPRNDTRLKAPKPLSSKLSSFFLDDEAEEEEDDYSSEYDSSLEEGLEDDEAAREEYRLHGSISTRDSKASDSDSDSDFDSEEGSNDDDDDDYDYDDYDDSEDSDTVYYYEEGDADYKEKRRTGKKARHEHDEQDTHGEQNSHKDIREHDEVAEAVKDKSSKRQREETARPGKHRKYPISTRKKKKLVWPSTYICRSTGKPISQDIYDGELVFIMSCLMTLFDGYLESAGSKRENRDDVLSFRSWVQNNVTKPLEKLTLAVARSGRETQNALFKQLSQSISLTFSRPEQADSSQLLSCAISGQTCKPEQAATVSLIDDPCHFRPAQPEADSEYDATPHLFVIHERYTNLLYSAFHLRTLIVANGVYCLRWLREKDYMDKDYVTAFHMYRKAHPDFIHTMLSEVELSKSTIQLYVEGSLGKTAT